jgi:hypothetical protein
MSGPMSTIKPEGGDSNGKLKRKDYERELARLLVTGERIRDKRLPRRSRRDRSYR